MTGAEPAVPIEVRIDDLVVERSPGRPVARLAPELGQALREAGVPAGRVAEVARAVLGEIARQSP